MHNKYRQVFNENFTDEKYEKLLESIIQQFGTEAGFRIAETPVFFDSTFQGKLIKASQEVIEVLKDQNYIELANKVIPNKWNCKGESSHPNFIVADFAVCKNTEGDLHPMLIELQGFPSIFFFQLAFDSLYRASYEIPSELSSYFPGMDRENFKQLLSDIILADHQPHEVILLELEPEKQATYVDFIAAEQVLGIKTCCVTELYKIKNKLYYNDSKGNPVLIKRIYNRVIAEDWAQRPHLKAKFEWTDELDVTWAGHPNWFFKLSKFTLPFIKSEFVPQTWFVNQMNDIPADLENFVLKPLFGFSGTGVVFHVKPEDLAGLDDPSNYILQRKVEYYPGLQSLDGMVKAEVRVMMLWPDNQPNAIPTTNLTRLSRGELIGVKFNKNKTWVGGSLSYFGS